MFNLFKAAPDIELVSLFSAKECCQRLRAAIDSPRTFPARHPVIGQCDEKTLRLCKRLPARPTYGTYLEATLNESYGKTKLNCKFTMRPFQKLMVAFFIILAVSMELIILYAAYTGSASMSQTLFRSFLPFIVLGLSFLQYLPTLKKEQAERPFMIDYICKIVSAAPV